MKNNFLFATLFVCIGIVSCKKVQENKTTPINQSNGQSTAVNSDYSNIVNKVKQRSDKYFQVNAVGNDMHPTATGHDILIADIDGAIASYQSGNSLEGIIIDAAAASLKKALGVAAPPGNANVISLGVTGGPAANAANAYDFVGYWHYKIVHDAMVTPSLVTTTQNASFDELKYYNYSTSQLLNNGVYTSISLTYAGFLSVYTYTQNCLSLYPTVPAFTQAMVNDGYLGTTEKTILDNYTSVLSNAFNSSSPNAINNFVAYSVVVENDIKNSTLSAQLKQYLLSVMSTSRWGLAYWK
jgi:hypothetical protein